MYEPPAAIRVTCEAKPFRSLHFPRMAGVTPGLSTTTLPKGLGSLSTVIDATTPRRGAFVKQINVHRASRSPVSDLESDNIYYVNFKPYTTKLLWNEDLRPLWSPSCSP
jgi:hypothetical protein